MTRQEQIEDMCEAIASMICQIYNPQCDEHEPHTCSHCYANDTLIGDFAEMLYDAGYRKVDDFEAEDERLREVIRQLNTDYNRAWERLKSDCRKIGELKAENKQLKTECALLDDELRIARQDTIDVLNELKKHSYCDNTFTDCKWHRYVLVDDIDELLKEYE